MAANAASRVFNTNELAEAVLRHVDTKDLALYSRICSATNRSIHGSKKLKQILFLEPMPIHLQFTSGLPTSFFDKVQNTIICGSKRIKNTDVIATLNPFFQIDDAGDADDENDFNRLLFKGWTYIGFTIEFSQLSDLLNRCGNKFEAMFITQSPATKLEMGFKMELRLEDGTRLQDECYDTKAVCRTEGVRIVDLMASLKDVITRRERRSGLHVAFVKDQVDVLVVNFITHDASEVHEALRRERDEVQTLKCAS